MTRSRTPKLDISLPKSELTAQHTPRRDVRTLVRWFANALPGGAAGVSVLLARLDGPLRERRHLAAVALVIAHLRGDIRPAYWQRMTGIADADPRAIDRDMDRVWDALVDAKLVQRVLRYQTGSKRTSPHSRSFDDLPPKLAARWVRTNRWHLMEQDEELLFFDAVYMEPLLRGAANPDAARREDARAIVAHAARDLASQSVLYPEYAAETLPALARKFAKSARVARETGALEVAEYLERLASYGAPRTFDAAQALQAFIDLARCAPSQARHVRMGETERGFVGSVPYSARSSRVHIDRETGVISRVRRKVS